MNQVRTYRTEEENEINKKSKKVKCPNCKTIGFTVVKEECDFCAGICLFIYCFPLYLICLCQGKNILKKEVHYCKNCKHDCTDVEEYKESSFCILF